MLRNSGKRGWRRRVCLAVLAALLVLPAVPAGWGADEPPGGDGSLSVALRISGQAGDILAVEEYPIGPGTLEWDGQEIDRQSALGALLTVAGDRGIPVEIRSGAFGIYVARIGDDPADDDGWVYFVDGDSPFVGANAYPLEGGESLHFAHYSLGLYSLVLDAEVSQGPGGPLARFTATYTDGDREAVPAAGAGIFVSDTLDDWGSPVAADGPPLGETGDDGVLEMDWREAGTRYPYAQWQGRSSRYQWPVASFSTIVVTLRVTGMAGDVVPPVSLALAGDQWEHDGILLDTQSAMGALAWYAGSQGIPLLIGQGDWGIYVRQIGDDPDNDWNWIYHVNRNSPWTGAAEYRLEDGDFLHFAHWGLSLYPSLSSDDALLLGSEDPVIVVSLDGSEFTDGAGDPANWVVRPGTTGLVLSGVEVLSPVQARLAFSGITQSGVLSVEAAPEALSADTPSAILEKTVRRQETVTPTGHRWTRDGRTVLDALLRFQQPDGSFWWTEEIEGMAKLSTVQALDALVSLGHQGAPRGWMGEEADLDGVPARIESAIIRVVEWYQTHHSPPHSWEGLPALRAAGEDLDSAPWEGGQSWRDEDPGFSPSDTGTEHIQAIFRLLSVGLDPGAAWGGRDLYAELAAQQDPASGSLGANLGRHIWAMRALATAGEDWAEDSRILAAAHLVSRQNEQGYFLDLDTTGWALSALAPYRGEETVEAAIGAALDYLEGIQAATGGFQPPAGAWGPVPENSNANAAVISGLIAVGEDLLPGLTEFFVPDADTPVRIEMEDGSPGATLTLPLSEVGGRQTATLPETEVRVRANGELAYILEIPAGTVVDGPADWDGRMLLPRPLAPAEVPLQNGEVRAAVEIGASGLRLEFDQPVRLALLGQAGRQAGYVGADHVFVPIDRELPGDSGAGLARGEAGWIDVGPDLILWTTHFTRFVAFDPLPDPPPSGGGTGSGGGPGDARLSVRGRGGRTILSETSAEVSPGETVQSFTEKVLGARGISYRFRSGYMVSIDGLSEFDEGPGSGWMFSVNGTFPQQAAASTPVRDGDRVQWRYTTDLGADIGAGVPPGSLDPDASPEAADEDHIFEARDRGLEWIRSRRDFSIYDEFADWDALVLARLGEPVPAAYAAAVREMVRAEGGEFRRVTDHARLILVLDQLGEDPRNVAGHDLVEGMLRHEGMLRQGVNGPASVLWALDAGNHRITGEGVWNRYALVRAIAEMQRSHGGFTLDPDPSAPGNRDLTAMVLQALGPYREQATAREVAEAALEWLRMQEFPDSEGISQAILALSALGRDASSEVFPALEGSLLQALLRHQNPDGGFAHRVGEPSNEIATQQAMLALASWPPAGDPDGALARNVLLADEERVSGWALEGVRQAMAQGLMSGVSAAEPRFAPERTLTRAEALALLVRLRGAGPGGSDPLPFTDVDPGAWYHGYLRRAWEEGWVEGTGSGAFEPGRALTRQELAVLLARALSLPPAGEAGPPADSGHLADWSRDAVHAVFARGWMVGDGGRFRPLDPLSREMAAVVWIRILDEEGGLP